MQQPAAGDVLIICVGAIGVHGRPEFGGPACCWLGPGCGPPGPYWGLVHMAQSLSDTFAFGKCHVVKQLHSKQLRVWKMQLVLFRVEMQSCFCLHIFPSPIAIEPGDSTIFKGGGGICVRSCQTTESQHTAPTQFLGLSLHSQYMHLPKQRRIHIFTGVHVNFDWPSGQSHVDQIDWISNWPLFDVQYDLTSWSIMRLFGTVWY